MVYKNIYFILFFFINTSIVVGQENYKEANNLLVNKQYAQALELFINELKTTSNSNLNYKTGLCLFNLNKKQKALPYFELAIEQTTKKYDLENLEEESSPLEAYYYYANCQHASSNLLSAFLNYDKYYELAKNKDPLKFKSEIGMYQCRTAEDQSRQEPIYVVKNLGDSLNSNNNEYRPVISIDGSEIYFTSNRLRPDSSNSEFIDENSGTYFEDIYLSYRTSSGKWTDPNYLSFCKPSINNGSVSTSLNGERFFVYQDNKNNGDIFHSNFNITENQKLDTINSNEFNSPYKESHASQSSDGQSIYFSSDRPGGFGGLDIYRITKLPDGTWSKAQNLGESINSKSDEESPFIGTDGKTLYFSSNGAESIGGYDVFFSQLNEINEWSTPQNLGMPINTFGDDLYYSTMANGYMGVYASNSQNNSGDFNLFFAQSEISYYRNVTIFKGKIQTNNGNKIPEGISIHVRDLTEDGKTVMFKPRIRDGVYIMNLLPCHSYSVIYKFQNEPFYTTKKTVPCSSSYQEIHEELILDVVNLKITSTK